MACSYTLLRWPPVIAAIAGDQEGSLLRGDACDVIGDSLAAKSTSQAIDSLSHSTAR
jgi:hypothetical protein